MKLEKRRHFWKRKISLALSFAMCLTGIGIAPVRSDEVKAAQSIEITSADELKSIGVDPQFPLSGDYLLKADLDLTGMEWTPIGGGIGQRGSASGSNVFTGTFDGGGHIISGLTINKSGSAVESWQYGLFGIIGSSDSNDKASVKNLILSGTDICVDMQTNNTANYLSLGILAGEANRNAVIDNISIVDGTVRGNPSNAGDVVGVGGLIGEMRPNMDNSENNNGVSISNIYVGANVSSGSSTGQEYVGGIIGRIANLAPASVSACVFTGDVKFKGNDGHGIAGGTIFSNIVNCYSLSGKVEVGTKVTESELKSETLLPGLSADYWTAGQGGYLMPKQCADSEALQEILALSGLAPTLAEGDTYASVTKDFTVPLSVVIGGRQESITWSSEADAPLEFNADGTVTVKGVQADTDCVLTAVTSSGMTKRFSLTVKSNIHLQIDQSYATIGEPLTASFTVLPDGVTCTYEWRVDGASKGTGASYTPTEDDLEKMLEVTAIASKNGVEIGKYGPASMYVSRLPVVYIDTDDGLKITDKVNYKDATMRIQGNEKFNSDSSNPDKVDLYDGAIEIRGRGNSTWRPYEYNKLPYKIKLGTKTNLMGFGSSKHWALLANYMDESLIRNTTSYDLSGKMGMRYLKSTHVDVILNGSYAGNYQLVGNVRVDKNRVNVYNWEDLAEDVADAISAKEAEKGNTIKAGNLEDYLNENMQWITSDTVTYHGVTYKISEYYKGIPKTADGKVDVSGGFLFELDEYYDEASRFYTDNKLPIMFKSPEFIYPAGSGDSTKEYCPALFDYARKYLQAVEDSVNTEDFYVDIKKEASVADNAASFTEDYEGRQHYSELVDVDSLVRYLILNEFYWNTETMKKSTFMYKDRGEKLYIGPVWDMDWTSNSLVSASETWNYSVWMIRDRGTNASTPTQSASWYLSLIRDPYFVQKMLECYQENRENFEEIIKEGGIIDQDYAYLKESGDKNYDSGLQRYGCIMEFGPATERLKAFLSNRLTWMDQQFASHTSLLNSLGAYKASNQISVTADGLESGTAQTTYTASVSDSAIAKVAFYINGIQEGIVDVASGKAVFTSQDLHLERKAGASNVVQARAMDASGNLIEGVSNYEVFDKELPVLELTGTAVIQGAVRARVGSVLTAEVTGSNNTGILSYQWMADGKEISGATYQTYTLTEKELGKVITVVVSSSVETGTLTSAATEVILDEIQNDHLIINQVFGGGANDGSSISHSFIELYNPTETAVSLEGYKIGYFSGRAGAAGYTEEEVYLALNGQKEIPPHHSYLVRCEEQQKTDPATGNPITFTLNVDAFDQEWTIPAAEGEEPGVQTIANKRYKVVLYHDTDYVDGVSVNEDAVEGTPLLDPEGDEIVSKHKSVRRKNFADTDNNSLDFETVNYKKDKITAEKLEKNRPRTLADGEWGMEEPDPDPPAPDSDVLSGTVSIRGNAIVGAILYADVALDSEKNTYEGALSYQWKADGQAVSGAVSEFFAIEKAQLGKKISVEVTCPDSKVEGTLAPAALAQAVTETEAQRNHVIVNQVYGDGGKKDVPVSHSFIELYNPTSDEIDLNGYSITYVSAGQTEQLALNGKIPSRASYLIRGAEAKALSEAVKVDAFDQSWDLTIGNKQYSVVLKNKEAYVDGVAVNEDPVEGAAALVNPEGDEIISKNKAVRRIGFIDTDNNANDFEVLNYSKLPADLITKVIPRKSADGAWGLEEQPIEPVEPEKPDETLLQNANSALTEADGKDASKYEPESYRKMEEAKEELRNALETNDAEKIREALRKLQQALEALEEIEEEPKPGPDDKLLSEAQNALKDAQNLLNNASKYDPAAIKNLEALKNALESAILSNDAEKIQAAVLNLKNALAIKPIDGGSQDQPNLPAVGKKFKYNKNWYKVTKSAASGGTVVFLKPEKKTQSNVTIPKTAELDGIKFNVTAVAPKAFKNNKSLRKVMIKANITEIGAQAFQGAGKLKSIVIQSKALKKVGKNALKGVNAKCRIKVPKNKRNAYEKKFKKKGQKSTVKVVK